jgi:hypothetical protein
MTPNHYLNTILTYVMRKTISVLCVNVLSSTAIDGVRKAAERALNISTGKVVKHG